MATLFRPVSLFIFLFAFIFYLPSDYCLAEPPSNINIFAVCFVLSCKILITLLMIMWLSFVTHSNTLFHCNLCSLVCWFFWLLTFKAFFNFFYQCPTCTVFSLTSERLLWRVNFWIVLFKISANVNPAIWSCFLFLWHSFHIFAYFFFNHLLPLSFIVLLHFLYIWLNNSPFPWNLSILSFFNICLSCLLFYDIFTLLLIVCIYIFVKQSIYLCNTWNFQISLNFFFSSLSTLVSCQSQYSSVLIFSVLLSCLNLSASTAIPLAFFLFFCVYHSPRIPFLLIQCSKYLYSSVLVITPLFKNLMCPY